MLTALLVCLRAIGLICRGGHQAVALENLALRQQLAALTRSSKRPHLRSRDRLFWIGLAHAWRDWRRALVVVLPDTVVRWHREWLRRRWTARSGPKPIRRLVEQMAAANPLWGAATCCAVMRCRGHCWRRRSADSRARLPSSACRSGFAATTGARFASTGLAGLSRLSVWWIRLGIIPERIALGHPEQNGSHEQFHAVLKAETARPPAANAVAQQRRFTRFCVEYNDERPHAALANEVPAKCYRPSPRALPARLPPLEYPGHLEIRGVSPIGQVSWRNTLVFVSGALAGEDVAFEEVDDGIWTVLFATVVLGRLNERDRKILPLAPFRPRRGCSSRRGSARAHPLVNRGSRRSS
jgi:hypothetical protein